MRKYIDKDIEEHYKKCRTRQTVDHVTNMHIKYICRGGKRKMKVWDMIDSLNNFIDVSDPDINLPNVHHLFQTAESLRKDGKPEWMQVVGLIHDLGKILFLVGCDEDGTSIKEQWSIVGDTFIVGCKIPKECVYSKFNKKNPDMHDNRYKTKYGRYSAAVGFEHCTFSFGHDEYLYQILLYNGSNLPKEALYIIRFHSFYAWHKEGAYSHLANEKDIEMLKYLQEFSKYDLYTKKDEKIDIESVKPYYEELLQKFLPEELWF